MTRELHSGTGQPETAATTPMLCVAVRSHSVEVGRVLRMMCEALIWPRSTLLRLGLGLLTDLSSAVQNCSLVFRGETEQVNRLIVQDDIQ